VTLVLHDWGSALGFHWAYRNQPAVKGIAYMEAIVTPLRWADWEERSRGIFQTMRGPAGEEVVLQKNVFVERILPLAMMRKITDAEMAVYRKPYVEAGESRRPTLTWPRQIPVDGEPADVVAIVNEYAQWLSGSTVPKLFINAEPGTILTGRQRDFCRKWPNQREVTVKGLHFIQEDSPHEIGAALADWYT
jgi:haloalkane dehalogenase